MDNTGSQNRGRSASDALTTTLDVAVLGSGPLKQAIHLELTRETELQIASPDAPTRSAVVVLVPDVLGPSLDDAAGQAEGLIEQMDRRGPVRRLVLVSCMEAAGPRLPEVGELYEDVAPEPRSSAGEAFLALERAAGEWSAEACADLVILRCGHVYGRGHPGFVGEILKKLEKNDRSWIRHHARDRLYVPIHVDDVLSAVRASLLGPPGLYHVTDGTSPTLAQILKTLYRAAALRRYPLRRIRPGFTKGASPEPVHWPYVSHLAVRRMDFEPRHPLWSGIEHLLLELQVPRSLARGDDGRLAGLARFETRAAADEQDVYSEEGRFWDQEHAHEELFFLDPHDWRFDVRLGKTLHAPVYRFVRKHLRRRGVKTVLELGCGQGPYALAMAEEAGIRVYAIDLARAKIETGRKVAAQRDLSHLVTFETANALEYLAPEKVDAICAFGTLHHLPQPEISLPAIIARNLKPGGILLAHEPHHEEGYAPGLTSFMHRVARSRFARFFDAERYERHQREVQEGSTLRRESPAGVHFHREDFHLDTFLGSTGRVLGIRYLNLLAPFVANMFVIYMRVRWVRTLVRALLPLIVMLDLCLCRFESWRQWASEFLIAVEPRRTKAGHETR